MRCTRYPQHQNERISHHNSKVDHYHKALDKAGKMWAARVKEGQRKWNDFHRRQAAEWKKIPQLIQWTPHVQRVVDEMVQRRFRKYVKFFVNYYLNPSPYVPISEHMKRLQSIRPFSNNGKTPAPDHDWFAQLPAGLNLDREPGAKAFSATRRSGGSFVQG